MLLRTKSAGVIPRGPEALNIINKNNDCWDISVWARDVDWLKESSSLRPDLYKRLKAEPARTRVLSGSQKITWQCLTWFVPLNNIHVNEQWRLTAGAHEEVLEVIRRHKEGYGRTPCSTEWSWMNVKQTHTLTHVHTHSRTHTQTHTAATAHTQALSHWSSHSGCQKNIP